MMEFIKTLREKQLSSRQNTITELAHSCICLDDYDGKAYIAFNGAPLIPIDDSWTSREILTKLEETRNRYIDYKMQHSTSRSTLS